MCAKTVAELSPIGYFETKMIQHLQCLCYIMPHYLH